MITITRKLEFDAGHRVMNHESKCATLHGHRYVIEVKATAPELDSIGRVIDFSVLKEKIGTWLDTMWDHNCLVWSEDVLTLELLQKMPKKKEPFVCSFNPTAENMASYLLREIAPSLMIGTDVTIVGIKVWETPNCYAEAVL